MFSQSRQMKNGFVSFTRYQLSSPIIDDKIVPDVYRNIQSRTEDNEIEITIIQLPSEPVVYQFHPRVDISFFSTGSVHFPFYKFLDIQLPLSYMFENFL